MPPTTSTISLPDINVPEGCEAQAAEIIESVGNMIAMLGNPAVVNDPAMRTMTTSFEHSLNHGKQQAHVLASAAKRRKAS